MKKKKEKKITIYDPVVDAYREITVTNAKKYIERLKKVEKDIKHYDKR